jgi:hypothetical protein
MKPPQLTDAKSLAAPRVVPWTVSMLFSPRGKEMELVVAQVSFGGGLGEG